MKEAAKHLVAHYEACLKKHGACAKGMDWPDEQDMYARFDVMLGVVRPALARVSLLDLGCGAGLLLSYIEKMGVAKKFDYIGVDLSEKMIKAANGRNSGRCFEVRDILSEPFPEKSIDYIVMNGVLTEKRDLSQRKIEIYAKELIRSAFASCKYGLAFNVMSSHVDWFREDLFHWPLDRVVSFLVKNCSRNISIRMDYGLYEYTVYVYRSPNR